MSRDQITPEQIEQNRLWNWTGGKEGERLIMHGADLRGADLNRADLGGADLSEANLYAADLGMANLYAADLGRANLNRANLYAADLSRANLYAANLSRANLYAANLNRANLYGANLGRANLYGANLNRVFGVFVVHGDRYVWCIVQHDGGICIQAGCHWFTVAEARAHWAGDNEHATTCRASIDAAVSMAKARGWEVE